MIELVHFDICDQLKVRSHSGGLNFVTIIDNYSRKLWVYALTRNDVFKHFQASIEREIGNKLKCIHTNKDDEYRRPFDVDQFLAS